MFFFYPPLDEVVDIIMRPTLSSAQKPQQFFLVASSSNKQIDGGNVITADSIRPATTMKIRINPLTQRPSTSNLANALQQLQHDSINNNTQRPSQTMQNVASSLATNLASTIQANFMSTQIAVAAAGNINFTFFLFGLQGSL